MIKARITISFEYEVKPAYYDGETDPQKMVDSDVADFNENPFSLVEFMDDHELTITGGVIPQ